MVASVALHSGPTEASTVPTSFSAAVGQEVCWPSCVGQCSQVPSHPVHGTDHMCMATDTAATRMWLLGFNRKMQ